MDGHRAEGRVKLRVLRNSCGVITSTAFGAKAGSVEQIASVPPGAQTPNRNA